MSYLDTAHKNSKCVVCQEPATVSADFIGMTFLAQFKGTAGGWHPACAMCDKLNDLFWDLKMVPFNVEMDYK